MKKILFMLLLCTPLLYMGCKAEPEWVNLIAQQEQEKAKKQAEKSIHTKFHKKAPIAKQEIYIVPS